MAGIKIETTPIDKLVPYVNNARTHSPEQVDQIAASIKEFGFNNPVLIDKKNGIIAGHGRVMAARKLELKEVPTVRLEHLTESQKKAFILADNKIAMNAGWDDELLALELKDLDDVMFDLNLTGFDGKELDELIQPEPVAGLTDEDAVGEVPETPVTVLGDLWILGRHRVVCGDATKIEDWKKLKIEDGIVTFSSPPYNLGDSIKLRGNSSLNEKKSAYSTYQDNASENDYVELIENALSCGIAHCDVVAFNLQPLSKSKRPLMRLMADHASNLIDIITWDKGNAAPQMAAGVMSSRYEWIFLFSSKNNASRSVPYASWKGKWSNVYQAPPQRNNEFAKIHGATFPVHLPEFMIGDIMNRCRGVVDCFCGTGATIIAAEKLGKIGYGIEIDPKYCDVIVERWQNFTGKEAVNEAGQKYNDLKNESKTAQIA
jgi:ParB-like chromosome segregation protein Spo0J